MCSTSTFGSCLGSGSATITRSTSTTGSVLGKTTDSSLATGSCLGSGWETSTGSTLTFGSCLVSDSCLGSDTTGGSTFLTSGFNSGAVCCFDFSSLVESCFSSCLISTKSNVVIFWGFLTAVWIRTILLAGPGIAPLISTILSSGNNLTIDKFWIVQVSWP